MSWLIARRRSVTNSPPALLASTAPGVSAPLIGEPTPLTEATPMTSQVPISSASSVSVQPLSARRPKGLACNEGQGEQMREQLRAQGKEMKAYAGHMRDLVRAIQMSGLQISLPVPDLVTPSTSESLHLEDFHILYN
ncbi:hypothetical protein DVH24_003457 [Malus domestica]|uniref:Uncharacterized protein n=1 Tax=Malus domestica TaxID=3750 RepID=A0A498IIK8_MALDO|nr:hypothetical protein DVH24_003457 [Malus domestica]